MLRYTSLTLLLLLAIGASAQSASEKAAVRITATAQASTPSITLNWATLASTTSLTIYRKTKTGTAWGSAVATPSPSTLTWTDNSVTIGTNYEYKIVRVAGGVTGTGYISTGIQLPVVDYRGKIILLVDNTLAASLGTELDQLTNDLRGDGWAVLRSDVSRTASVTSVRSIVQGHYNSDPANVKALYIIGHVPVPYSGNIYPDGHDDNRGARPTDGYYGDVNGTWTDNTVNVSVSSQQRTWNIPGDGKFDQSDFPSAIELQVGRVDMYDMPAFNSSEVELVRSYLNRAHNYKVKAWAPTSRALLVDKLEWLGNPVGASGWRASALVGPSSPVPAAPVLNFRDYANGSYLWTAHYGGGLITVENGVSTYNGTDGGVTTQQLASSVTMGGVFNMALGSFFLDWDSRNNLLRAVIARGDGLTNCWAGIPAWYFHHMGMGENIGYSVRETMNNTGLYLPLTEGWQSSIGRTHLNLMGDPSLRMKMVKPPTNLLITNSNGSAAFSWSASTETVSGYHLYRIDNSTGTITRLTTTPITSTTYSNGAIPFAAGQQYMVRAVVLETGASGSYYNMSLGASGVSSGSASTDCLGVPGGSATIGSTCNDNNACTINDVYNSSCQCIGTAITPVATITPSGTVGFCTGGSVTLNANTGTGLSYVWRRNGTVITGATGSSYTATQAGSYAVTVTNSGCSTSSANTTVTVNSAPTATITAAGSTTFCAGGNVVLNANTGTGLTYTWRRGGTAISGATGSSYTATQAGSYTVVVGNGGCTTTSSAITVNVNAAPTATINAAGATSFCAGGSVVLNATTGTGFSYAWRHNGTAINGATSSSYTASQAGSYIVTITSGGCSVTSAAVTVTINAAPTATITASGPTTFCTGGSVTLNANTGTGYSYSWRRNGTAISGATSSSYSTTLAGSYTVQVSNGGCSTTSNATTVSVTNGPTATITPAGATSFCSGGSVVLNANTGTGLSYVWRRNGTVITGATGSSYTATQAGSYTLSVTSGGCTGTSTATVVTVSALPNAALTATGPLTFCSGGSVTLNASAGTGYSYVWYRNTSVISGATSSSYSATQTGAYSVAVVNGGCSNRSGSVSVTVNNPPTVSCSSSPAARTVTSSASGGLAPYTYAWNTSPVQTTATATVNVSGTYTVTVTDARGCTASCTTTITISANNCAGIRTETQSSWGASVTNGSPVSYLAGNFAAAFPAPNYLTIGCGGRRLRLTSASAVRAFLPSYGSSVRLPNGTMMNPTSYSNTLAGELVALKLSVRFDEMNSAFSPATTLLKNMVIATGTFAGWTVQQLINAADAKIGNCGGNYGRNTLANAIAAVNAGYAGGTTNSGYLQCPGTSGMILQTADDEPVNNSLIEPTLLTVQVFPNPVRTQANIFIEGSAKDEPTTFEVHSLSGALIEQRHLGVLAQGVPHRIEWNVDGKQAGVYLYRIVSGDRVATGRMIVD